MVITDFQRGICRLLAAERRRRGESYVADGVALNALIEGRRISRDIDIFHDTDEALAATWEADRRTLEGQGYVVTPVRERPGFVEAEITAGGSTVLMQWARDSAFRFFPLVTHEDFGLALHPFDLATNKVLALVGRLETRDWVDLVKCAERIQPLGYLAWAACGKDPGFSPKAILQEAGRTTHYTQAEMDQLSFEGPPPDAASLSRVWRPMLQTASSLIELLPAEHAGKCVVDRQGRLYSGTPDQLRQALAQGKILFHEGSIGGAIPQIRWQR